MNRFHLEANYDSYELCFVEEKVPCRKGGKVEWRTDVRAVRDAAAHFNFNLKITNDGWSLDDR